MRRKVAGPAYSAGGGKRELPIMGKRLSQRVEPRQELRIVPPPRWFRGFGRRIDLIECLAFCGSEQESVREAILRYFLHAGECDEFGVAHRQPLGLQQ
jgi:hypothetical protein